MNINSKINDVASHNASQVISLKDEILRGNSRISRSEERVEILIEKIDATQEKIKELKRSIVNDQASQSYCLYQIDINKREMKNESETHVEKVAENLKPKELGQEQKEYCDKIKQIDEKILELRKEYGSLDNKIKNKLTNKEDLTILLKKYKRLLKTFSKYIKFLDGFIVSAKKQIKKSTYKLGNEYIEIIDDGIQEGYSKQRTNSSKKGK